MKITKNTTIFRDLDGGQVIMNTRRLEEIHPKGSTRAVWHATVKELQQAALRTNNGENFGEADGVRIFSDQLPWLSHIPEGVAVTFGNFEANGIYRIGCRHFGRTTFRRILRKAGVTL